METVAFTFGGIGLSGRRVKFCMPVFKMNEMMPKFAVFSSDKRHCTATAVQLYVMPLSYLRGCIRKPIHNDEVLNCRRIVYK